MSHTNHDEDEDLLTFSLSCSSLKRSATQSPATTQTPFMTEPGTSSNINNINSTMAASEHVHQNVPAPVRSYSRSRRRRRSAASQEKSETIPPPFPWATDRRATVHRLSYLLENRILDIKGKVECKRCKIKFDMVLDLKHNLSQLLNFIGNEKKNMHNRAPKVWTRPVLPKCGHCGQDNSVQPSFEDTKKKNINWLFLFLGQMMGCCTLAQLKYLLKHNNIHRTGSKDHNLYSSYICICEQLLALSPQSDS